jgi:hypothetical protein
MVVSYCLLDIHGVEYSDVDSLIRIWTGKRVACALFLIASMAAGGYSEAGQVSVLPPIAVVNPVPRPSPQPLPPDSRPSAPIQENSGVTGTASPPGVGSVRSASVDNQLETTGRTTPVPAEMLKSIGSFDLSRLTTEQLITSLTLLRNALRSVDLSSDQQAFFREQSRRLSGELSTRDAESR